MLRLGHSGVLGEGRWRWARAIGWMVALAALMVIGFNVVSRLVMLAAGPAPSDGLRFAAALAGVLAILLFYWLAVRFGERRPVDELALTDLPAELALGLAIGAALIGAIVGIQWLAGWVEVSVKPVDSVLLALRDSLRSGVLEEVLMRLVIFRLLWRAFGIWPAIVGAALLFGLLHAGNPDSSLFALACLMAGEGILIGLYLLTGRIWAPIGAHAAWNFTQGWLFGAAVSGVGMIAGGPLTTIPAPGVDPLLSGGGFGPEASLAALIVSLVGSAFFLHRAWRKGAFVAAD